MLQIVRLIVPDEKHTDERLRSRPIEVCLSLLAEIALRYWDFIQQPRVGLLQIWQDLFVRLCSGRSGWLEIPEICQCPTNAAVPIRCNLALLKRWRTGLLYHVRQFMGQQSPPLRRPRRMLAGAKDDIAAHGVSLGVDCARRHRSLRVGMHAHATEVATEACLEKPAVYRIQTFTGRS